MSPCNGPNDIIRFRKLIFWSPNLNQLKVPWTWGIPSFTCGFWKNISCFLRNLSCFLRDPSLASVSLRDPFYVFQIERSLLCFWEIYFFTYSILRDPFFSWEFPPISWETPFFTYSILRDPFFLESSLLFLERPLLCFWEIPFLPIVSWEILFFLRDTFYVFERPLFYL